MGGNNELDRANNYIVTLYALKGTRDTEPFLQRPARLPGIKDVGNEICYKEDLADVESLISNSPKPNK